VTRSYSLIVPAFLIEILLGIAGLIILWICIKFFHNYTLKDGSIAMIICMFMCTDLFFYGFIGKHPTLFTALTFSQICSVILFIGAGTLLIKNQLIQQPKKR
jgi:prolipoprotein diacylglyceryltransferase